MCMVFWLDLDYHSYTRKKVVGIQPKCFFGGFLDYHSQKKVVGIQLKWFSSQTLNCHTQGKKVVSTKKS